MVIHSFKKIRSLTQIPYVITHLKTGFHFEKRFDFMGETKVSNVKLIFTCEPSM